MENKPKNREWVKNAAIIFLAVLLVLTFFSNTIMNRSLPEAATEYVQSGPITAKVRGTGTVESQGNYEVKAPQTREIRAVMVKSGQQVETGDVLFVLGNGDSAEIETLTDQIRQLRLSYQQTAVGATNYGGQLQKAQTRYNNAVAAEAAALAQLNGNPDFQSALTALESSKTELASAELNYKLANETALQSIDSLLSAFNDFETACASIGVDTLGLNDAKYAISNARQALSSEDGSLASVTTAYDKLADAEFKVKQFELEHSSEIPETMPEYVSLTTYLTQSLGYVSDDSKNNDVIDTVNALMKAIERNTSAQNLYDGFSSMFTDSYNAAVAERQTAEAALKTLQDSADDQNRQAALTGLSLQDLSYQIERAQQKLNELTGGSDNQILSNVSGTVSEISVTAGTTATKDQVIAKIEVPDMGYTLSFSVTTDQAKRLRPGDSASVTSFYWGSTIEATLSAIKPDPKNPQTNRLLEFDVTGDVTAGTQLSLAIGERSATYDIIVPNSSIRSDANGKFVLVVQAKNSPLGNRYFAKRVNVEVIASDDNNSAVTGSLNYGDYVITTASAPIKSGDQVRMAEG
ncbi:MAG: HlyD family efflux transporter periplasmic adaptor subunit [Oscillospiraceae bacterium]|nr:HlyD family efflux transporter periplasmic adaptor subunit [Oscillospiraceae bacterium]